MGVGPGVYSTLQSLKHDPSVKDRKVAPGTARRIFGYIRPYRVKVGFLFLMIGIDAVIGAVDPLIYRQIINQGILGDSASVVVRLALLVAGLSVVDGAALLLQRWVSVAIGQGLIFDLRTRVYAHVQRMGLGFFVRTQTGALVSRLDNDVTGAETALTNLLSMVIGNVMRVTAVLVAMFALSWQLTLLALVLLPLFAAPARWLGRRIQAITREGYDLTAQMNATMVERFNVAGALLVTLFGRLPEEDRDFASKAGRVRDIAITRGLYGRVFFVALTLTAALATALVYGWGGVLAIDGLLDIGTVVALTAYLGRLYAPLTSLSNIHVDVMTALVSFERVFEVLDLPPLVPERPNARVIPRGPARVEFEDVGFAYPAAGDVALASLESVGVPDAAGGSSGLLEAGTVAPGPGSRTIGYRSIRVEARCSPTACSSALVFLTVISTSDMGVLGGLTMLPWMNRRFYFSLPD